MLAVFTRMAGDAWDQYSRVTHRHVRSSTPQPDLIARRAVWRRSTSLNPTGVVSGEPPSLTEAPPCRCAQ
jgi:hypothetical protein